MQIIPLSQIEPDVVEALLDTAFGTDRHKRTAYTLREGVTAVNSLSFAAVNDKGDLLGTIQCWPCGLFDEIGQIIQPLTLVGPVAVSPAAQNKGIGKALMDQSIHAAGSHSDGPLCMIGDPKYYGRFFGFSAEATGNWQVPGPVERHRLLARVVKDENISRDGRLGPRFDGL